MTAFAAARITLSVSELRAKLQKGIHFYVEQSDALFKVVTNAKDTLSPQFLFMVGSRKGK